MLPTSDSFDQPTQTGNDQATPVAKTGGKKLTGKQKAVLFAGLGGAAAIAGGSALAWGMSEEDGKANNNHPETKPAAETPTKVEEPKPSTETPSDSTHVSTSPRPEVAPNATSSHTTPSETSETPIPHEPMVATHVTDDMSFEDAFKTARAEVGPGGYFEWNDHLYNTYYKEEWEAMSEKQREDYAASLNDETRSESTHSASDNTSRADVKIGEYNGQTVALGDGDHDGDAEAIVFSDGKTGIIDRDNDGIMDTRVELDPETHTITAEAPLATTFAAPKLSDLDSFNNRPVSNETTPETKPVVVTTEYQGHTIVAGDTDHDGDAEVVIVDGTSGAVDTDNDGILETRIELDPNSHEVIASAPMTEVYNAPALSDFGTSQNQTTPANDTTPEVEVVTVNQDGHEVTMGDSNHDGYVDIVMLEDGKTVFDADGDHQFDTVAQVDMNTGEVLSAAPLEHPIEAPTMDSFSSDENRMASNDYDNNADVSDWVA